ncbi:MAG: carbohydrate ABC transporter permease [Thermicanus sp.]|nr:carbohydrate ABC transporter permease [Thermicanus sp.]
MRAIKLLSLYLFLMIAGLFLLYPLFFTFSTSLMTPEEAGIYPPKLLPSHLYLNNFKEALETAPLVRFLLNSTVVSLIVTAGQLLTSSLAAYAFAFIPFKGRNLLFALFLSTMMIPWEVAVIPNYLTIKSWGWLDSYQGLTVPFLASAFGTFLLRQSFLQLPKDLIEAAKIDGAGHLRIYAGIVLPIARPALATLGVYAFLTTWNMYLWPLLITNSETMRTVQIGVGMLQWQEFTAWNLVLAGITIVLLPSLLVLLFGLKQLIQGLSAGALKG